MKSLLLRKPPALFIAGVEAVDVSRMTGIPWFHGRTETRGARHPMIDLLQLTHWDRVRVTWALVAGYAFLESQGYDRAELEAERNLAYWEGVW